MNKRSQPYYRRELFIGANILAICLFGAIIFAYPSVSLALAGLLLLIFVSGNVLFHHRTVKLNADTLLEYALIALLLLFLTYSALNR